MAPPANSGLRASERSPKRRSCSMSGRTASQLAAKRGSRRPRQYYGFRVDRFAIPVLLSEDGTDSFRNEHRPLPGRRSRLALRACDTSSEHPATTIPNGAAASIPRSFRRAKMLAYYAERFTTVEVNYTFYRMPTPALLEGWAKGTPDAFTFTFKAPRRITHDSKLQRCEELTAGLLQNRGRPWIQARSPAVSTAADVQAQRRGPCRASSTSCPRGRVRRSSSVTSHGTTNRCSTVSAERTLRSAWPTARR